MDFILSSAYKGILALLVVYALLHFRKIKEGGAGFLVLVLALSLLADLIGTYAKNRFSFTWGYNLFTILVFPAYFGLVRHMLPGRVRAAIPYLAGAFLVLGMANFLFFQGIKSFNQYTLLAGASFMILFSLLYFKSRFDNPHHVNLLQSWHFWLATGLLLYFTGTLFYFSFIKYLAALDMQWRIYIYSLLQFMNILMYTMFGIALLCLTRRQTLSQ